MKKFLAAALCFLTAVCPIVQAAELFWSGDGTSQGGAGTWNTTLARWGTSASGPFSTVWNNANGDSATLDATAGAITMGSPIIMNGTLSALITGYSTLSVAGASTITFTPGGTVHVPSGTFTLNTPYAGMMTKTGAGTITLNNSLGSMTNFFVNGGTLSAASFNRYGSGADTPGFFTLNGGGLSANTTASWLHGRSIAIGANGGFLSGSSGIFLNLDRPVTGNNNGIFTNRGPTTILLNTNNSGNWTLVAESGTVRVGASGVIPNASPLVVAGGTVNLAGGYIRYMARTAAGTGYTSAPTVTIDNTGSGGTGAAGTAVLSGTTVSRIDITAAGSGYTSAPNITLTGGGGTGGTASLNAIIGNFAQTVASVTVSSGTLSGTGATLNSGPVTVTGGTVSVANLNGTSYDLQHGIVSSVLGGSGVAATKSTAGTIALGGANTFTGGLAINEGTVLVNNNAALGAANSAVTIANGITLAATNTTARTLTYNYTLNGNVTIGQAAIGTGALTLAGTMNLGGATRTLTIDNPTDTISAIISNGGIEKVGSGTLALTGTNTYSGSTILTSGRLNVSTASSGGGSFSQADGTTMGIILTSVGASLPMSDFTVGNSTMEFDLAYLGLPVTKVVNNIGAITVHGTIPVDVKGFDTAGTATLMEYAGPRSGIGSGFTTGNLPPRVTGTIIDDTVNKKVIFNATAADTLVWGSDPSGIWDLNNSANLVWKLAVAGSPTYYQENLVQGDTVRFDDTASDTTTINLTTTNSPFRVTVDCSSSNYTFTGIGRISGNGKLVKNGSGQLTITTTNSYTGGTTLNNGALNVGQNSALGTGRLTINNSSVLIRSDSTNARTLSVATDLNGDLTLGDSINTGALTLSGAWTIQGASRQISVVDLASATISGAIGQDVSGRGLTKGGTGTLSLTGANTFDGGFNHNVGTVRVNSTTALGMSNSPVIFANGVTLSTTAGTGRTLTYAFNINGNITLGQTVGGTAAVTLAGTADLGGAIRTITISNATDTISAAISNGGLIKAGTGILILTGTNSYAAGTTVNEGTLQGSTFGLQGNILNNTALIFNQGAGSNGTYAGAITGSGTLTKNGTGTVVLSGNNSVGGAATITAGTLIVDGTLAAASLLASNNTTLGGSGTISAPVTVTGSIGAGASAGLLTLANGLTMSAGTNVWELATNSTTGVGSNFDQVALTGGNLALGGTSRLSLKFINSNTPTNTESFWQAPRSWKVISLSGTATNSGASNFAAIDGTNSVNASTGTFSTSVDATGVFLNYIPNAPAQPTINPIVGAGTGNAQISFNSTEGVNYTVQYKTNLNHVGWLDLTNLTATASTTTVNDTTNPSPDERYYRIIVP